MSCLIFPTHSLLLICIGLTILVCQGQGRTRPLTSDEIAQMRSSNGPQNRKSRCFYPSSFWPGIVRESTEKPNQQVWAIDPRTESIYDYDGDGNGSSFPGRYSKPPKPPLGLQRYVM